MKSEKEEKSISKSKVAIIILSIVLALSLYVNVVMIYRYDRLRDYIEEEFSVSEDDMLSVEELAPDFSVQLLTGETFTLSEHRGTVVVLDFWATWCGPCVAKMPAMQALSEQFEGDAIIVGINVGEQGERIHEFIDERGFTYPIGVDESAYIHINLYPSPGVPYTVVIGRDGVIVDTFLGGGTHTEELIENAIMEAIS
ncbi:MAG: TlpA family protein disulfide reductase [Oscillospiraceae bacterium]|nr:TlpA family protein disulfide reductase [Oscillospiraceae bacterium]